MYRFQFSDYLNFIGGAYKDRFFFFIFIEPNDLACPSLLWTTASRLLRAGIDAVCDHRNVLRPTRTSKCQQQSRLVSYRDSVGCFFTSQNRAESADRLRNIFPVFVMRFYHQTTLCSTVPFRGDKYENRIIKSYLIGSAIDKTNDKSTMLSTVKQKKQFPSK